MSNWIHSNTSFFKKEMLKDIAQEAKEASLLLKTTSMIKVAGTRAATISIDPSVKEKFKINIKIDDDGMLVIDQDSGISIMPHKDGKIEGDFEERSIPILSPINRESHHVCNLLFHQPQKEVWAVSAYFLNTYLGQYVYRANWYFKQSNRDKAVKCFFKAEDAILQLKDDVVNNGRKSSEMPLLARRALKDIHGEVEPHLNTMANYLNPKNVPISDTVGAENIVYIPTKRPLDMDLKI